MVHVHVRQGKCCTNKMKHIEQVRVEMSEEGGKKCQVGVRQRQRFRLEREGQTDDMSDTLVLERQITLGHNNVNNQSIFTNKLINQSNKQTHLARVDLENLQTRRLVWQRYLDLPVESTWTKKGRIQDVGSIRRHHNLDGTECLESIQLVQ